MSIRIVCPYCDDDPEDCGWCNGTGFLDPEEAEAIQARAETFDPEELCELQQASLSAGHGGKPQYQAVSRQPSSTSPRAASTPSGSSPTGSGRVGRSCPPASGGSPANSTLKPANSSPLKPAAPKSTGGPLTLGGFGHG